MAFDFRAGQLINCEHATLAVLQRHPHAEYPTVFRGREVFVLLPPDGFVGMTAMDPSPQHTVDVPVQVAEGPRRYSIAEVVGPTTQSRVELSHERLLIEAASGLNQRTDLRSQDFHFALCRSDQQFVPILAHGVPQKVEALLNVGDDGLLL